MIFAPPGSAKSSYVSRLFPNWYLANHHGHNVLFATHTTTFSDKWGRLVRNDIDEHKLLLGLELAADSQAANRWALTNGSSYLAVGAGSAVTGYRADLTLLDDIVKGSEDADSDLIREKLFQWYKSDVITRLKPGGKIVLIMTRWRVNDIAGQLLEEAERGGEQWRVLNLPAEAELDDPLGRAPGELLWGDDSFGYAEHLRKMKEVHSARDWQSLYQQRPVALGGNFFNESWLTPYDKLPPREQLRFYGGTDFAVSVDKGDYTCLLVAALDRSENLYLVDIWRGRTSPAEWVDHLLDMHHRWGCASWGVEKGQLAAAVGPFLEKRARERRIYPHLVPFPSRADKPTRARAIQGFMNYRGLHVNIRAPWYGPFLAELLSFPAGKHDDQVDALGLIGQQLSHMRPRRSTTPIGAHAIQTPTGPQFIKSVNVVEPTLDRLWQDRDNLPTIERWP